MMDEKDLIKRLGCRRIEPDRRQPLRRAVDVCRETVIEGIACDKTWAQIAGDLKARHGITSAVTQADVTRLRHGDRAAAPTAAGPMPAETLRRIVERAGVGTDTPDPAAPDDAVVTAGWAPAPQAIRRGARRQNAVPAARPRAETPKASRDWDPWEELHAASG